MSKKQMCLNNKSFGYYSGLGGLELKHIEYGINDYVYCVSGAWCNNKSYHKVKINYDSKGNPYIMVHGYKVPFEEIIRM